MTLLIISPDYASHLLPLAALGTAWRDRGERVVVATGESTADIVTSFGYERVHLQLGRGSNPGVIRAADQVDTEADSLRGFFDATRVGMVETLRYQAQERLVDLMWNPVEAGGAVLRLVDELRPDAILIDHLAFSARLALQVAGVPFADVVLGHPAALPVGDEAYGYPISWPSDIEPDPDALAELRALCDRVSDGFTAEWNRVARELDPTARDTTASRATASAFSEHGPLVLYNYPEVLADPERELLLPPHDYLGSAIRDEPADAEVDAWLASSAEPFVYVSFGSFLSVRDDVLTRVADALRAVGARAAIASGSTPPEAFGEMPDGWLVREYLPQVRLLGSAALAVTHGGNNSVTEAVASGVPMLVLPFSTEQFPAAAAIERIGIGEAFDPNTVTLERLAASIERLLALGGQPRTLLDAERTAAQDSGPERAFRAVTASATS